MTVGPTFARCPGCGRRRLIWPEGTCVDCRPPEPPPEPAPELVRFAQLAMFPKAGGR